MGHISPKVAKHLVQDGLVTGIELCGPHNAGFCESCVFVKSKCKPIPDGRSGERVSEFGGEVHSDVWGPAPIKTVGHHCYYVSLTDD
ncbi:hypothetical protein JAAARDRAFT_88633, partial [Jaapia argillacea MUCL 33604]